MNPIRWHQITLPIVVCVAFAGLAIRLPAAPPVRAARPRCDGRMHAVLQDQVSGAAVPGILHGPSPTHTGSHRPDCYSASVGAFLARGGVGFCSGSCWDLLQQSARGHGVPTVREPACA